jgi:hypothetical protein
MMTFLLQAACAVRRLRVIIFLLLPTILRLLRVRGSWWPGIVAGCTSAWTQ